MKRVTKKEFMAMLPGMKRPVVHRKMWAVYLREDDCPHYGDPLYFSSRFGEAGLTSASNQLRQYRAWLEEYREQKAAK